ncbi:diacylglycerol kinase [Alteromonas facilis]|uniref:diacylglycerol kinase n=1 Tax=Alteromonas facilis TaxID=2048004 RepID=UPI000C2880C1|nr:diacylglycerol kinase [Alteromonas facilis]
MDNNTQTFTSSDKATGIKRVFLAAKNSAVGIRWMLKNEAAFRQECALLICALPFVFWMDFSLVERLLLIVSILFVMLTETINTAIEAVVDRISDEIHPLSGLAKDLGSAAVAISMVIAAAIWVIVLIGH